MALKNIETQLGRKIIYEDFNSIYKFMNTVTKRDVSKWVDSSVRDGRLDRGEWVGRIRYEDAKNMIVNGWDKPLKKVVNEINNIDNLSVIESGHKPVDYKAVAGYRPIVPNAIMGLPRAMMARKMVSKKVKVVNVLFDFTFSSSVTHDEAVNKAIETITQLYLLEKKGFRVRLTGLASFGREETNQMHVLKIMLKEENQPFDIKKLMFPMVHSGMLRMLCFDWYESVPNGIEISGYGYPIFLWDSKYLDDLLNAVMEGKRYYYINYKTKVSEMFANVK